MTKTKKDNRNKLKIKIIDSSKLPPEIKDVVDDIIKNIKTKKQASKPEQEQEGLQCEVHLQHYRRYIGICFDENNEKIGTLHTDDNSKFESFLKDSGNTNDGFIRKVIVYEAKKAVLDTTKYHKGKKKKPKKVITVQAPRD